MVCPEMSGDLSMATVARRDFLRGRFSTPERGVLRPPPAIAEGAFKIACDGCVKCVSACPTGVIRLDGERRPVLDFTHGECDRCDACAAACPTGALDAAMARPWLAGAVIGTQCLTTRGVACRSCGDSCPSDAIRFQPRLNAPAAPSVTLAACTGCGACVGVCPTGATRVDASARCDIAVSPATALMTDQGAVA
jgi:ferredoxin-type protein NapF